jgi:hypothetical protein
MQTTIPQTPIRLLANLIACCALCAPACAATVSTSNRTIYVTSTANAASRTTPGAFVASKTTGTDETTSADQDSALTQSGTLLHLTGNGSTSAVRTSTTTPSISHLSESYFDATFSFLNDSPYLLTGRLTIDDPVLLAGTPKLDSSSAIVQLQELNGPVLFTFGSDASFSRNGIFAGGKTYQLHIGSTISLQSTAAFNKTNAWTFDFLTTDVPEPASVVLMLFVAPLWGCSRRRSSVSDGR